MAPPRQPKRGRPPGFSLLEMLVVIALISILMALMVPAINGLLGISGPRGGVNALAAAIDNAKIAAMDNGVFTYLGFPAYSSDPSKRLSRVIIFRGRKDGEANAFTPLGRWIALPDGIFAESDDMIDVEVDEKNLPPLGDEDITRLQTIGFDCFGKPLGPPEASVIRVGEKNSPDGEFIGPVNSHFVITLEPLTGRANVQQSVSQR